MNRRKSLKTIALGTVASGLLVDACKPGDEKNNANTTIASSLDVTRMMEEIDADKELMAKHFFTKEEMETITILADIIIPKDEVSGSASDAKVAEFIDFIVGDMPEHQIPMRGGLRWLHIQCLKNYNKSFVDCDENQRIEMVDKIAYPEKATTEMKPGVSFFNLMRNLTATGFYSTEIGWKDIDFQGNTPYQWNGVPDDVLKQYGLSYTEKELKECVSFDSK